MTSDRRFFPFSSLYIEGCFFAAQEQTKRRWKNAENRTRNCYSRNAGYCGVIRKRTNFLVKEIVLYNDKIEIYFNTPIKTSPDDESRRGLFILLRLWQLTLQNTKQTGTAKPSNDNRDVYCIRK